MLCKEQSGMNSIELRDTYFCLYSKLCNYLYKAAQNGASKCLHWLLEKGFNVNAVDGK